MEGKKIYVEPQKANRRRNTVTCSISLSLFVDLIPYFSAIWTVSHLHKHLITEPYSFHRFTAQTPSCLALGFTVNKDFAKFVIVADSLWCFLIQTAVAKISSRDGLKTQVPPDIFFCFSLFFKFRFKLHTQKSIKWFMSNLNCKKRDITGYIVRCWVHRMVAGLRLGGSKACSATN